MVEPFRTLPLTEEYPYICSDEDHERPPRDDQRQDPVEQAAGLRMPHRERFRNRHLPPSRRARPLSRRVDPHEFLKRTKANRVTPCRPFGYRWFTSRRSVPSAFLTKTHKYSVISL